MAGYSFAPSQVGGFGGGLLSLGQGAALGNAANAGLRLANGFREYQNSNMLDQYQIPAAEAGYHSAELQGANQAVLGQGTNAALLGLADTPAQPNVAPVGTPADGNVGQSGMAAVGGSMAYGNPYGANPYATDNLQLALTGDTSQRNALNYQPGESLNPNAPISAPGTAYIRY